MEPIGTMIYESLIHRAGVLTHGALTSLPTADRWTADLPARRAAFREMLALPSHPCDGPPPVTHTGMLDRSDYVVEKCFVEIFPRMRVAANIYRPRTIDAPLPGMIYVCGHAAEGKCWYQPHGRWFGRHGYVCMVLDHIWAGESRGFHHGTYSRNAWHWYSRGYSPAGVEVWAAMRAIDYLQSRDDVDGSRLGITGNSGGGSISWFTGAADERLTAVAPSCQTGNAYMQIKDRALDSHCDCTWWVNTLGWDHTDVAALIAPRALLVAAQTEDYHFRPYAYRDLVHRLSRLYRLLEAPERLALVEDSCPHGYTPKTRLGIFSWFDRHLKGAAGPATEDLDDANEPHEQLWVFPGGKAPDDDRMGEVDTCFVSLPEAPQATGRDAWQVHQAAAIAKLRETSFRQIPRRPEPAAVEVRAQGTHEQWAFWSLDFQVEPTLTIQAHLGLPRQGARPCPLIVAPLQAEARSPYSGWGAGVNRIDAGCSAFGTVEVRGTGRTSIGPGLEWTVRRAYPLLGCTLPERQTFDLLAGAAALRRQAGAGRVALYGTGASAALSVYAALLDETIEAVVLADPVWTHEVGGPEFLGILRVGDFPHNLALLWPRPILLVGAMPEEAAYVRSVYTACGAGGRVRTIDDLSQWPAAAAAARQENAIPAA
ncbi:MAG: acetylxylan esterase [Planctomycetes bacterium]|nr:acetylxylan esterase [Planctomycetota bacterium]